MDRALVRRIVAARVLRGPGTDLCADAVHRWRAHAGVRANLDRLRRVGTGGPRSGDLCAQAKRVERERDLALAAGPRLHLAHRDPEGVRPEPERPAQPLEEREGRRRVVAQAVEAVGEREVRGRALPAFPAKTGGLERGAKRPWREV